MENLSVKELRESIHNCRNYNTQYNSFFLGPHCKYFPRININTGFLSCRIKVNAKPSKYHTSHKQHSYSSLLKCPCCIKWKQNSVTKHHQDNLFDVKLISPFMTQNQCPQQKLTDQWVDPTHVHLWRWTWVGISTYINYSTVALVPSMSTMDVWRGIT